MWLQGDESSLSQSDMHPTAHDAHWVKTIAAAQFHPYTVLGGFLPQLTIDACSFSQVSCDNARQPNQHQF